MSFATNLLLIVFGINLILFVFGGSHYNSTLISTLIDIFDGGDFDYSYILENLGSNAGLYILLIGTVSVASFLTGSNPLTSGGGHGAIVALQIVAIAIFSSLLLVPNFSTMGFPSAAEGNLPILEIIQLIFGIMYVIAMVGLLRGIE